MFDEQEPPAPKRRGRRVEQTPVQRALGLLVRREHSRSELTRKLTARGIEREDAQAAVDKLSEAGWQDEQRFAHSLVRNRAAAGYGPLHIRAELGTHRLPEEMIRQAMDDYDGDWADNARELVRRRFSSGLADPARRRKAADLLARRGFGGQLVGQLLHGTGQDWDDQA